MKRLIFLTIAWVVWIQYSNAQLPDGSFAPDFTTTDINGNEHHLYDYLAQGYTVVLEMVAAWNTPAWQYHVGEVNSSLGEPSLETLWQSQGVETDGEVMVIMIECDELTTVELIFGGAGSQGDWTLDVTYPIADDTAVGTLYAVADYPTIYTICPTGIITQTGQLTAEGHWNFMDTSICQDATANDVAIMAYTGTTNGCGEEELSIEVANLGVNTITSLNISVAGVTPPISYDWSGTITQFASIEIMLGSATPVENETVVITITNTDDNAANNSIAPDIGAVTSTTHIHLELFTDIYPGDLIVHIYDEDGNEVITGGPWAEYGPELKPMFIAEDYWLPSTGCYELVLQDLYGDGIYAGAYCRAWGVTQDGDAMNFILYIEPSVFLLSAGNANVNEEVLPSVNETNFSDVLLLFPNPTNGNIAIELPDETQGSIVVKVYNLNGKLVLENRLTQPAMNGSRIAMDLSSLADGDYQISVMSESSCTSGIVSIQK